MKSLNPENPVQDKQTMSEWKKYKLGEIAEFSQGIQVDLNDQKNQPFENSVRFIRIVDFTKGTENEVRYISNPGQRYLVQSDDLVMIRYGSQTAGKIARGFNGAIANNTFKITLNEAIAIKSFVFYYLSQNSVFNFFHYSQASSTMPAITFDMIGSLEIDLPSLPEQTAIAEVLSSLDDKIDLLHRQNKTLEQLSETLFRQWFVEENKILKSLGEIARITTGKGLKRNEFIENGTYPILGANGEIGRSDRFLTDERIIITGRVGTLGEVKISDDKVWISDNVLIIKPNENIFFYPIYFTLKKFDFENINAGSTQPLVTQTDLKNIGIYFGIPKKLEEFETFCNNLFQKIKTNTQQIRTLTQLRDSLLPKLMSGEVRLNYDLK